MISIDSQSSDKLVVTLPDAASIYQAEEISAELMPLCQETKPLVVDLSQVNEVDSSVLQLLMQIKLRRDANGLKFNLSNHSPVVVSAMETLGLLSWFSDPVLISSADEEAVTN